MIAGELPADPALLSPGAGPVDIYANLIQGNLANDDGGGLRFLMAGNYFNVYNNIIANNVSTHEGGGVSLNDAPDVRFYNNTVMKNITTATAMTSNGWRRRPAFLLSSNSNCCRPRCRRRADLQRPADVQQHLLGQPGGLPLYLTGISGIGH
jgi:uncharacterized protein (DUF779 family)